MAAVDSARLDLDPDAEPAGTVRVGGFATGIRVSLLPIVADLAERYPKVEFVISEYEPIEAFALQTNDDLDLALTYDYNLAPASPGPVLETVAADRVPHESRCQSPSAVRTQGRADRVRSNASRAGNLASGADCARADAPAVRRSAAAPEVAAPRARALSVGRPERCACPGFAGSTQFMQGRV